MSDGSISRTLARGIPSWDVSKTDVEMGVRHDIWLSDNGGAPQPANAETDAKVVPLPLALQGPAAAAWQLVTDAKCTEEQIDAVALLALPLQMFSSHI